MERLNVLITGGSKGIGFALATKFVQLGDNVVITSRSESACAEALIQISAHAKNDDVRVKYVVCDITNSESLEKLPASAVEAIGGPIDIWINNAGMDQPEKLPLYETPPEDIKAVVYTNGLGTLLATRTALRLFVKQGFGHAFIMDGAGSNGMITKNFATYGWTKAGFPQLLKTLSSEMSSFKDIGVHLLSPGLVLTDLLLNGFAKDKRTLILFNILAEKPETVANYLVPRARSATIQNKKSQYIKFLTFMGVAWRFMTAFWRKNRLFNVDEMYNKLNNKTSSATSLT